ncbi:DUF3332 domain-containing protein [Ferrimonas aestuarii]|uniref:DUF3332 domain-containing protein n=1 Tax=Ferrimonas aestuarii TaxID=2569539 RepID=A0A4U1BRA7_9GAMM|nr:DUF3332 domain-containing protein [Ferrimonas aestuarii]TKB55454.1 DUF3332 domain-containing protein [Ferrimonas aestuarii]
MKLSKVGAVAALLACTQLSGCMGQMALSGLVTKGNLSLVDNRYGRAGLFVLMAPVYGVAASADLFVINTIEFWTGQNPISGRAPAVVDMPANTILKVNHKLNQDLTSAPVTLSKVTLSAIDANTMAMTMSYQDGRTQVLSGQKQGDWVEFYLDGEFITEVSIGELTAYVANRA